MADSLQQKAISGITWSAVQRFGTMGISFISNLFLARLLRPEDFGMIGMLMVFIAIGDTLVDGGFDSALIQKKQPTDTDYSTIFFFNLSISVFLYLLFFASAPVIASFYRMPQLSTILRVLGLMTIINASGLVQNNQLQKKLNFSRLATINVISISVSTTVGIIFALVGFGVWSLVIKTLLNSTMRSSLLWSLTKWKPLRVFSSISFKELFSFGGLIFLANSAETIVSQIVSLIIGRFYSSKDLGFYTQAGSLIQIPETTIPYIINQVFFPVFSSIQDDLNKVVSAFKKSLKALTFVNFPLMIILMLIAEPLIHLLFTDKWRSSVPYFQLLCLGGMLYSVNSTNVNFLKALGRGRDILYLSIVKRVITLLSIIVGIRFGIYGIIAGGVIGTYLWLPANAHYTGKLAGYGAIKQIRDIGPNFLLSIVVGVAVFFGLGTLEIENHLVLILLKVTCYVSLYLLAAFLSKNAALDIYLGIAKEVVQKRYRKVEYD